MALRTSSCIWSSVISFRSASCSIMASTWAWISPISLEYSSTPQAYAGGPGGEPPGGRPSGLPASGVVEVCPPPRPYSGRPGLGRPQVRPAHLLVLQEVGRPARQHDPAGLQHVAPVGH